jgi:hypothetical protein
MERCISMSHRLALLALVILTSILTSSARAERSVVLVTHEGCAMETISMLVIRKAYFGIAVSYQGHLVRAYRLNNDDELSRIFYQTVVAMSQKSYERRLRSMLLKYGTPRPQEFAHVELLVAALRRSDCGIAYMWGEDAAAAEGIKSIRLLWQGD